MWGLGELIPLSVPQIHWAHLVMISVLMYALLFIFYYMDPPKKHLSPAQCSYSTVDFATTGYRKTPPWVSNSINLCRFLAEGYPNTSMSWQWCRCGPALSTCLPYLPHSPFDLQALLAQAFHQSHSVHPVLEDRGHPEGELENEKESTPYYGSPSCDKKYGNHRPDVCIVLH